MPAVFVYIHDCTYDIMKIAWMKCENYTFEG